MAYYAISALINSLTSLVLGVYLLLKGRTRVTRAFSLWCFSVAGWCCGYFFWQLADSVGEALFFCRWLMAFVVFIPTLHLHFIFEFLELYTKYRALLSAYYATSVVLLLTALHGGWLIAGIEPQLGFPFWPMAGPAFYVFTTMVFSSVFYPHYLLWTQAQCASGIRRTQIQFIFWGSLLAFLGASTNLPLWYRIPLPPIGNALVALYVVATTYAILQHRLFDMHVVIRKSLIYSLLVTTLTISYFGLMYAVERLFQTTFGYRSLGLSLGAFALMAAAFQPLKAAIQAVVERLLFRAPREELVRRLERYEQEAQQAEKMKAVATLASGLAHEIKNPLTAIKTFAEHLPDRYDDRVFREKFARIVGQEAERVTALVQRLLEFAKPSPPNKEPARLSQLMDETMQLLQSQLVNKHIEVTKRYAEQDAVQVDRSQMRQVFLNVLLNSLEAMDGHGGRIEVAITAADGQVEVAVSDTGSGIAARDLAHVFDPFYTTKTAGTGLGLSVVHSIIQEHGGQIGLESEVGRGTTIRIQLPTA